MVKHPVYMILSEQHTDCPNLCLHEEKKSLEFT